MKFNPLDWNEVKPNEEIKAPKGWLRVRLSAPCPLYVKTQGREALAGVGSSFDLEIPQAVTFRAEAPKGVRVFCNAPPVSSVVFQGEVFTNIDRMVNESGAVAEVTKALRQLELMRRASLKELRVESAKLKALRNPEPEPVVVEPEPAPVVETKGEAD
jgi:hypothetical protein